MIQGFGQEITEIPALGHDITEVRAMGQLVWQKSTAIPDYLCFTALEAGTFTLSVPAAVTSTYLSYVEYSLDGRNWTRLTVDSTDQTITTPTIAQGDKVYWRGSGIRYMANDTRANNYFSQASYFSSTGRFDVSGNIMSMLYADDFGGKTSFPGTSSQYENIGAMFQHCTNLVHAKDLLLPAMTLKHLCYTGMFEYCSSLVDAPALPATSVGSANYCYRYMYRYCSSLVEPSDLSHVTDTGRSSFQEMYRGCTSLIETTFPQAATYGWYCCYGMYLGCTSITSADMSYARTLNGNSCPQLFFGCTNLKYVKCLATDISATDCLTNWLYNVSSTGTFIQASGVTWPRGASGIPTGWLAYDEGWEIPNDYTPCDYIYNSQTANGGVDLGFKFRILDYSAEAKFKQDDISNGMVMGTKNSDSGAIWWYNYTSGKSFRINACDSSSWKYNVNGFAPLDTNTHIIRYVGDTDGCYQISDGTQSGIHDISTWAADESTDNLFVFGRSATYNTYKGRIYYLKVWNTATEEVICNLIPCSRNSDGAAGFWDTAQKKFFTSTYWTAHFDNE